MGTLDENGFLSPEIQNWIENHRRTYEHWFSLCETVNRLTQALMLALEPRREDERGVIVVLLLSRVLSHFQGIILLTERGMIAEARSLLRGMLDAAFGAIALAKDATVLKDFVNDDVFQRQKVVNSLISMPRTFRKRHRVGAKRLAAISAELSQQMERDKLKPLTSEYLAQKAGLTILYTTLFTVLSSSTHSRVRDLERHIEKDDDDALTGLKWGPDVSDLEYILAPGCEVLFQCARAVRDLFSYTPLDQRYVTAWNEFEALVKAGNAA